MSDENRALGTGAKCCGTCGCLESIETPAPAVAPAPVLVDDEDEEPTS